MSYDAPTAEVTEDTLTDAQIQSILDDGLDPNVHEDRELAAVIQAARSPLHSRRRDEARRRIAAHLNRGKSR